MSLQVAREETNTQVDWIYRLPHDPMKIVLEYSVAKDIECIFEIYMRSVPMPLAADNPMLKTYQRAMTQTLDGNNAVSQLLLGHSYLPQKESGIVRDYLNFEDISNLFAQFLKTLPRPLNVTHPNSLFYHNLLIDKASLIDKILCEDSNISSFFGYPIQEIQKELKGLGLTQQVNSWIEQTRKEWTAAYGCVDAINYPIIQDAISLVLLNKMIPKYLYTPFALENGEWAAISPTPSEFPLVYPLAVNVSNTIMVMHTERLGYDSINPDDDVFRHMSKRQKSCNKYLSRAHPDRVTSAMDAVFGELVSFLNGRNSSTFEEMCRQSINILNATAHQNIKKQIIEALISSLTDEIESNTQHLSREQKEDNPLLEEISMMEQLIAEMEGVASECEAFGGGDTDYGSD